MKASVEHDVAHDITVGTLTAILEKHGGTFGRNFIAVGPAGGNPLMTFEFPDREKALAYLTESYPDDSPEWLAETHISDVEG